MPKKDRDQGNNQRKEWKIDEGLMWAITRRII